MLLEEDQKSSVNFGAVVGGGTVGTRLLPPLNYPDSDVQLLFALYQKKEKALDILAVLSAR